MVFRPIKSHHQQKNAKIYPPPRNGDATNLDKSHRRLGKQSVGVADDISPSCRTSLDVVIETAYDVPVGRFFQVARFDLVDAFLYGSLCPSVNASGGGCDVIPDAYRSAVYAPKGVGVRHEAFRTVAAVSWRVRLSVGGFVLRRRGEVQRVQLVLFRSRRGFQPSLRRVVVLEVVFGGGEVVWRMGCRRGCQGGGDY